MDHPVAAIVNTAPLRISVADLNKFVRIGLAGCHPYATIKRRRESRQFASVCFIDLGGMVMNTARARTADFSVVAYQGDAKTLLAFDFDTVETPVGLAGFTVEVKPPNFPAYYLLNNLCFANPSNHAQVGTEDKFSTVNAPLHKFRWVHVPGSAHQGLEPEFGEYAYTVFPRYFRKGRLLPLNPALGTSVTLTVAPYAEGRVRVGFTRGFVQSQAFVRHFGPKARISPKGAGIDFDTSAQAGTAPDGAPFTYAEQYRWLGFTARTMLFEALREVEEDNSLTLDLFAYDLNEPDFTAAVLRIAAAGRGRAILDNAALHHNKKDPEREDVFERLFEAAAPGRIKRGRFDRYAHNKVLIISEAGRARTVITGSTNFSVTGFYVNSNHVLRFDEPEIAGLYADMFQHVWDSDVRANAFVSSPFATVAHQFGAPLPKIEVNFSPHTRADAERVLGELVARIDAERESAPGKRSVLFAVMQMTGGKENPVYDILNTLHEHDALFSFGISDTPKGIALHRVGQRTGVLVTGKPGVTRLPRPFNQVPGIGLGHQVHHKFVVCGFNGPDPVVYCGSSNLALAGEQDNGDNLLAIHDAGLATVFAIEAIALVDHFAFLNKMTDGKQSQGAAPPASKQLAAEEVGWHLGTTHRWAHKYFDKDDLHMADRILFGREELAAGALPEGALKFLSARIAPPSGLTLLLNRADPSDNEIEEAVGQAIADMVEQETPAEFSWSLVPSKELSDGGLGVGWNAWHALLDDLKSRHLLRKAPYSKLVIDDLLVDTTFDKNLRTVRSEVVKRVKLARDHS